MAKKCVPGVICIENVTLLFIIIVFIGLGIAFYYRLWEDKKRINMKTTNINMPIHHALMPVSDRNDTINDPYAPPLTNRDIYYPRNTIDIRGVPPVAGIPVNIQTRAVNSTYQQVGILTRMGNSGENDILPLMGRRIMSGRDKWQFYTIANNGNLNTKLPVSVNGKSCTGEYGCDDINNSDVVFVEGYNDTFKVTMYENNLFQYIPSL